MRNPKFLGVHSRRDTGKKGRQARYPSYFAWRLPDGGYAVQELDQAYTAKGPAIAVPADKFDLLFKAEPSILAAPVITPDFRQARQPQREERQADDSFAKLEAARRAKQLETSLRDSFSRALRALSRSRDRKAALASIERIAATKQGIVVDHKHMFRDFGVSLRKKSLLDLALACAGRAVELSPNDDHARFNFARLLGMAGRFNEAEEHLSVAERLDPEEKVYGRLRRHLAQERARSAGKES